MLSWKFEAGLFVTCICTVFCFYWWLILIGFCFNCNKKEKISRQFLLKSFTSFFFFFFFFFSPLIDSTTAFLYMFYKHKGVCRGAVYFSTTSILLCPFPNYFFFTVDVTDGWKHYALHWELYHSLCRTAADSTNAKWIGKEKQLITWTRPDERKKFRRKPKAWNAILGQ